MTLFPTKFTAVWFALLGLFLFSTVANASTTIPVTTVDDLIADDGECSLREAVIAANTDRDFSDCPAGTGGDTIVFAADLPSPATIVLTTIGANEDLAATGDLDVAGTLTIDGSSTNAVVVIDGNGTDRVFELLTSTNLILVDLTIQNGNPGIGVNGGGILANLTSRLTINNSHIHSNSGLTGGGIKVMGRLNLTESTIALNQGGGLSTDGGLATLTDVQLLNNTGHGIETTNAGVLIYNGGLVDGNSSSGLYASTSSTTLNGVTITNNGGSGVHNEGNVLARLTINQSTIMSNTANNGGGILNEGTGTNAKISQSRISGNSATSGGGGIFNNGIMTVQTSTIDGNQARSGGGIRNFGGSLTLVNDTISANVSSDNGGGIYSSASATLDHVTLVNNQSSTGSNLFNDEAGLSLHNSIIAMPQDGANCANSLGTLTSIGYNLESANSCNLNATGDQVDSDPMLNSLADNGGPTLTHNLQVSSPAIDAADPASCPTIDQRGATRPPGGRCDIGAVEADTVVPEPADEAITGLVAQSNSPTDLGISTSFTATAATGTNITYSWSFGDGSSGIGGTGGTGGTVSHLYALNGTYTATVTATNSISIVSATTAVAVVVPTIIVPTETITLTFIPIAPMSSDIISITVSGRHRNSCIPAYGSHSVIGATISISSTQSGEQFCLPTETGWSHTTPVGPLPAGNYSIIHTLGDHVVQIPMPVVAETTPPTTPIPPPDREPPGPVSALEARHVTTDSVTLLWNSVTDNIRVAGYQIFAQEEASQEESSQEVPMLVGDTLCAIPQFVVTSLKPDTSYAIWVVAYDAAGNVGAFDEAEPIHIETQASDSIDEAISGFVVHSSTPTYLGGSTYYAATTESGTGILFGWDFGDGQVGAGQTISHTYGATGVYSVTAVALNGVNMLKQTIPVTVEAAIQPVTPITLTIEYTPQMPTTSDIISIVISGLHANSCVPSYDSHAVIGQSIAITTISSSELFCLPTETVWGYTIDVGPLAANDYAITHSLDGVITQQALSVHDDPGEATSNGGNSTVPDDSGLTNPGGSRPELQEAIYLPSVIAN